MTGRIKTVVITCANNGFGEVAVRAFAFRGYEHHTPKSALLGVDQDVPAGTWSEPFR